MKNRILLIVLVGLGFGLPSLAYPYGRDQGIFGMVGRTILEGDLPYRDVFDFKPPAIFYAYALIQAALGSAAWTFRLVDLLWQMVVALVLAEVGTRLVNGATGRMAAVLYLISYHVLGFWNTAQPEGFLVLPLLWFVLLITEKTGPARDARPGTDSPDHMAPQMRAVASTPLLRSVAAGLLLGTAGLFKYTALSLLPLACLRLGRGPHGGRRWFVPLRLLWVTLGAALPLLLWAVYALGAGLWEEFYYIEFVFTPAYVKLSHPGLLASLGGLIGILVRGFGLPWWCYLGLVSAAASSLVFRGFRTTSRPLFAGLALGAIGVIAQGKYFPYHMVLLLPWFALLMAAVVDLGGRACAESFRVPRRRATTVGLWVLVLGSVPLAAPIWHAYFHTGLGRDTDRWLSRFFTSDFRALAGNRLAHYLRTATDPDEAVYIWGFEPEVYLLCQRRCASRFIYNLPQRTVFETGRWRAELLEDLARDPPAAVVVQRGDRLPRVTGNDLDSASALGQFPELAAWLTRGYSFTREVSGFRVFLRRAR